MAVLGRWSGGAVSILPTTSWTAPADLAPIEVRNDGYTWSSATSTLTLPSSGLADGYLLIAAFAFNDTSNGRCTQNGRWQQASGAGTFVTATTSGYNRDSSENISYVRAWAFVDSPSASGTYQFQWRRDTDAPTGGTREADIEVIPLFYSDFAAYTSTATTLLGGTTPQQVTGFGGTDGGNITLSGSAVTLAGDNKRYLCLGSQFFDYGGNSRTQRWHGFRVDGVKEDAAKAYSYYRNAANGRAGEMFTWLIETATADVTIDQFCYRGDGVASGQGGADVDGSTSSAGAAHSIVVLELNNSAEVFRSTGSTNQNLAVTGPVDLTVTQAADVDFSDNASFTRASDSGMSAETAMDALIGANISAASQAVSTGQRWTAEAYVTVNGVERPETLSGEYLRNNQGSQDTFGWSGNLLSFLDLSPGDDIGLSVQELAGTEGGGGAANTQAGWVGFWGINLDTLEDAEGGTDALTADPIESETNSGLSALGQVHSLAVSALSLNVTLQAPELEAVAGVDALAANGLSLAPPVGDPAIAQLHSLAASGGSLAVSISSADLGQVHGLVADGVGAQPSVATTGLGQDHAFQAVPISTGATLGEPAIATEGSDALTAASIGVAAGVGAPALGQAHAIAADGIEAAPSTGPAGAAQVENLTANSALVSVEVEVGSIGQAHLISAEGVEAESTVPAPQVGQVHALGASGLAVRSDIEAPDFGVVVVLEAAALSAPVQIEAAGFGQAYSFSGEALSLVVTTGAAGVGLQDEFQSAGGRAVDAGGRLNLSAVRNAVVLGESNGVCPSGARRGHSAHR